KAARQSLSIRDRSGFCSGPQEYRPAGGGASTGGITGERGAGLVTVIRAACFARSLEDRAVHRGVCNHGDDRRLATVEKGSDIVARESTAVSKTSCDRYGASALVACPRSLRQRLGRLTRRDEVGHRALSECD